MFVCDCCEKKVGAKVKAVKRMKIVREATDKDPAVRTEVFICPDCAEMLHRQIPYAAVTRIRRQRVAEELQASKPIPLQTTSSGPLAKQVRSLPKHVGRTTRR